MLSCVRNPWLVLVLFPAFAFAQAHPSPPPPSLVDNEQVIAYWTTETGWKSELQLRNNRLSGDLTVTPVLRQADGSETPLAAVTIKPHEVASVDLEQAIGTTAPQLIGSFGSVVLRFHSPVSGNLYAALMVHNMGHPFTFHIDASAELQGYQAGSREGVWWLPKGTSSDYLILTNQGGFNLPVDLSFYDATGKESKQRAVLGPRQTIRYSVRQLITAAKLNGIYGGIKVSAAAQKHARPQSFDNL